MSEIVYPIFTQFDPDSIARRALIYANPLYFSLNVIEQARYRVGRKDEDDRKIVNRIQNDILSCLKKRRVSITLPSNSHDSDKLQNRYKNFLEDWVCLLVNHGIGSPICFDKLHVLGERDFLDVNYTIYDYHLEQMKFSYDFDENGQPKIISFFLYQSVSVKLIVDSKFYYGTISSVTDYVMEQVNSYANDFIYELIPHDYDGGFGFVWDKKLRADGKEAQLEELKVRWRRKFKQFYSSLDNVQKNLPPKTFIKYQFIDNSEFCPHVDMIINNSRAAQLICLSELMHDALKYKADFYEVRLLIAKEKNKARFFLEEQYNDIEDSFDMKIIRL